MFNYRKSFQIIVLEEVEKNVSIKELDRDQYVSCSLDQNYKFIVVPGELLTL